MALLLRFICPLAFLALIAGCKTGDAKNGPPIEKRLPEYIALGGSLSVFEPADPPQPIKKANLHDLSYAYTYNMFHIRKDTLWKREQATYLARQAAQVVKEEFPEINVVEGSKLEGKNYVEIMHTRAYPSSPYRETPPDQRERNKGLLVPAKNGFQLFIETSTGINKDGTLGTRFVVRVFNTRSAELVYFDNLFFSLDFRDSRTWRTALKFMLERLKENSEPPAHTPSGQNRR